MKLGKTGLNPTSQSGKLFNLRDVENKSIKVLSERRNNNGTYGRFTTWRVDNSILQLSYLQPSNDDDEDGTMVTPDSIDVAVNEGNVPDRTVHSFFTEYPGETLECVVHKTMGTNGREYWTVTDPDEWEGQQLEEGPFHGLLAETPPTPTTTAPSKAARSGKQG